MSYETIDSTLKVPELKMKSVNLRITQDFLIYFLFHSDQYVRAHSFQQIRNANKNNIHAIAIVFTGYLSTGKVESLCTLSWYKNSATKRYPWRNCCKIVTSLIVLTLTFPLQIQ